VRRIFTESQRVGSCAKSEIQCQFFNPSGERGGSPINIPLSEQDLLRQRWPIGRQLARRINYHEIAVEAAHAESFRGM
jgi:hypothetical protein